MLVGSGAASAGCPRHKTHDCVVNLSLAPAVSRQIVGGEKIGSRPAKPPVEELPAYTGPTIGAVPNIPRAPEIGYRWSIN
jgi:hypothetical protein